MRTSSGWGSLVDESEDRIDHLVDGQVIGVDDDGIARGPQWGHCAFGIDTVAGRHLLAHGVLIYVLAALFVLRSATPHLLLEARGEEEFAISVGEHNGAD